MFEYEDNRSSAVAQRKLQENANESPLVRRTSKFQSIADEQFDLSHSIQRKVKNIASNENTDNTIQLQEDFDNLNDESTIIEEKDARQEIREENPNLIEDDGSDSNKQIEIRLIDFLTVLILKRNRIKK